MSLSRHDVYSRTIFFCLLSLLIYVVGGFSLAHHLIFTVLPCLSITWSAIPLYLLGLWRQVDYVVFLRATWQILTYPFLKPTERGGVYHFQSQVYTYDMDWMCHMNNTKYLTVAKLARQAALQEQGWWCRTCPYNISSYNAAYYREMKLGDKFIVKTSFENVAPAPNCLTIRQIFCNVQEDKVVFRLNCNAIATTEEYKRYLTSN